MNQYTIYGLNLATELILPLPVANSTEAMPVIFLKKGKFPSKTGLHLVDHQQIEDFQQSEIYQANDGSFETFVYRENNCQLYVKNGQEVIISPETDIEHNQEHFSFFLHIAFSTLLYHRKCLLFHGSAIAYKGKGYLFLGHSGAGKSTTASSLIHQGGKFLTDDIGLVYKKEGCYYIAPSYNFIKVTPTTFQKLKNIGRTFESHALLEEGKYLCKLPQNHVASTPVKLDKVFHLYIDNKKTTHFKEQKGVVKLNRLLDNAARPEGLKRYKLEANFHKACFTLHSEVPVIDVYRKFDEFIAEEVKYFLDQNS